jgi:hypothetical protein
MAQLLRIGTHETPVVDVSVTGGKGRTDVPLADYEAELLLKAGR